MAKIKFFALILKNTFEHFLNLIIDTLLEQNQQTKKINSFNHSFKNKVFLPYSKFLERDY
ncbi:hypothetical protein BXP23_03500 [Helicobacter pylori]|uniref:Uncharacterized protein n=1 Tax=Helicobacter pylori (strain B8) TaxID=693745 RepID=D7FDM7_HELP3|nr:hypothetical protein [Helicobacter pylori]AHZ25514.1 hypothetical protein EG65_04375 [Helicobacter pylori J166]QDY56733.1 hypothetical protein CV725_06315 [Helicobacter pylori B128]CBI66284.1 hypothetical protein predicted by Glimmer/Critica [Helicobacter pylori B8]AVG73600.1 hypothetical protein BXP01_03510 [Helicobacter pylori]AVG79647.1 hypothetical protein BXP12_03490 [Helicobacter pylori]